MRRARSTEERTLRTLLVYESLWGNTKLIAAAIAEALGQVGTVDLFDSDSAPSTTDDYDLLVVGGPTHAFSMTRTTTRASAVDADGAPHLPHDGIREWLGRVTPPDRRMPAVTFDTKVASPRLPGSAAAAAKRRLRTKGFETPVRAMSFRVHGYEGPLVDGESGRAHAWALRSHAPLSARA